MTKSLTTKLTKAQKETLVNSATHYKINEDKLIDTVQYMKHDRFKDGLVAYEHFKFIGGVVYKAYKEDKKTYFDTINGVFMGCLTKDEINYSVRLAGYAKKAETELIDCKAHKAFLSSYTDSDGNKVAIFSCRRMVDLYVKSLIVVKEDKKTNEKEDEKEDENKNYTALEIMQAYTMFTKMFEKSGDDMSQEELSKLGEKLESDLDQSFTLAEKYAKEVEKAAIEA